MKNLTTTIVFLCTLLLSAKAAPNDFKTVNNRIEETFAVPVPKDNDIEKILDKLQDDGSFIDVKYNNEAFNSGHKKNEHVLRLGKMARAYVSDKSAYRGNKELFEKTCVSLDFWITLNDQDQNWWWRIIGYPKNLMYPIALLADELKAQDPDLYNRLIAYEKYAWSIPKQRAQLGANGTDICKYMFVVAALERDQALMDEVMEKVYSLIEVVDGPNTEGIQRDWAFTQHCGTGRQLYLGTYGKEYVDGVVYFLQFVVGTAWNFPAEKIAIIENLFTEGLAWCWYKGEMDANQCGRKIAEENSGAAFMKLLKKVIALGTPRKGDLSKVLAMMEDRSQIIGCRAYPSCDYLIQRGEGYCTTIHMTSTRTVGNEAGNGQGLSNYHTGDGSCYIKTHGKEYSPIYDHWNWRMIPGTTVAVDNEPLPSPFWGQGGLGGNDYAGVVSDGKVGAAAFIFDKDKVTAHKAWFCFEKFMVCLGAGITSARNDAPVITTINQCAFEGAPAVGTNLKSLYHAGVGYVFGCEGVTAAKVSDGRSKDILLVDINHGVAPSEASYEWAVYPAIEAEEFEFVATGKKEYEVLANSCNAQAVRVGGKVLAAFYGAGQIAVDKKISLSCDKAAILVYDIKAGTVIVANPYCESLPVDEIGISVEGAGKKGISVTYKK